MRALVVRRQLDWPLPSRPRILDQRAEDGDRRGHDGDGALGRAEDEQVDAVDCACECFQSAAGPLSSFRVEGTKLESTY